MAEKERYIIRIGNREVEVNPEVYYAYYRMERQELWQEEKKRDHKEVSYDALDDRETLGIDNMTDITALTMDEIVAARELRDKVRHAVALLPRAERELIQAIYYKEVSERDVAVKLGMSQNRVFKNRLRILEKLRRILDAAGLF